MEPHELELEDEPFNEFNTQFLASLAFPCLFPDTQGDPTSRAMLRDISDSDTDSFSQKLKHFIKFAEYRNKKWFYRFPSHPRFAYWVYNILYRRRLIGQGNFYIKQNPSEALLSIHELRSMLQSGSYTQVMNKIIHYAKQITGTNAYRCQVKEQLKATLTQVGSPTIFWTLSCAEFHWPEFHTLFQESDMLAIASTDIRNNILNYPHILGWLFTERTEAFVKHWLYGILQCKWHWFRYESSLQRGSIHCHGLAKLDSDPGLCDLTKVALEGFLAAKKLSNESVSSEEQVHLQSLVHNGAVAEREICEYNDYILTTCNPTDESVWEKATLHPCKIQYNDISDADLDADYTDLVNTVQRHTKCNSAYCLKSDKNGN